jgi:hypothetical protein
VGQSVWPIGSAHRASASHTRGYLRRASFLSEKGLITRVSQRTRYLNAVNTIKELLSMGVVPIVNENDTVSVSVGSDLLCHSNTEHRSYVVPGN